MLLIDDKAIARAGRAAHGKDADMGECFTGNTMKRCACGAERRPGQRNCYTCHKLANNAYRQRLRERADALRRLAFKKMAQETAITVRTQRNCAPDGRPPPREPLDDSREPL